MKPNKKRIQLLVDALRSGEFNQGQGNLRRDNSYCCLGVACEVYRRKTNDGLWRPVGGGTVHDFVIGSSARSGYLPGPVAEWFGFESTNPELKTASGRTATATFLNDIDSFSLAKVGEAFERTYLTNADTK